MTTSVCLSLCPVLCLSPVVPVAHMYRKLPNQSKTRDVISIIFSPSTDVFFVTIYEIFLRKLLFTIQRKCSFKNCFFCEYMQIKNGVLLLFLLVLGIPLLIVLAVILLHDGNKIEGCC